MSETRSPLRERLLHVPGQSLDETINRLWDDRGVMYAMAMAAFVCVALVDWYRWLTHVPLRPWVTSVWAAVVTAYSIRGLVRLRKQTKLLEQGRDGERAVAEVLEAVREQGGRVFHDIVGEGFNVDHVVLSTRGVFVIETKTLSKPRGGTVKVEGRQIIAGGANLGAKPIEQAETNARWVRDLLKQSTGKGYPVKPCLVFPSWFVEPMPRETAREVWVLNPKALAVFIENEPVCVRDEDLYLAAYHLSRYIRSPWAAEDGAFAKALMDERERRQAHARTLL